MKDLVATIRKKAKVYVPQLKEMFEDEAGLARAMTNFIQEILEFLPKEAFNQTEGNFKNSISSKIDGLAYTKKAHTVMELWESKTKTLDTDTWSKQNAMALEWVMPEFDSVFKVVARLSHKEQVGPEELDKTVSSMVSMDFSALTNQDQMDRCFISNVASEKYEGLLLPHVERVKQKLRQYLIIAIFKFREKLFYKKLKFERNPWWIAENFNEFVGRFLRKVGNE